MAVTSLLSWIASYTTVSVLGVALFVALGGLAFMAVATHDFTCDRCGRRWALWGTRRIRQSQTVGQHWHTSRRCIHHREERF